MPAIKMFRGHGPLLQKQSPNNTLMARCQLPILHLLQQIADCLLLVLLQVAFICGHCDNQRLASLLA